MEGLEQRRLAEWEEVSRRGGAEGRGDGMGVCEGGGLGGGRVGGGHPARHLDVM